MALPQIHPIPQTPVVNLETGRLNPDWESYFSEITSHIFKVITVSANVDYFSLPAHTHVIKTMNITLPNYIGNLNSNDRFLVTLTNLPAWGVVVTDGFYASANTITVRISNISTVSVNAAYEFDVTIIRL